MKKDKKEIKDKLLKLTADFCNKYLNDEYKELCKKLINKMSRKRDVPFLRGRIDIWASAVIHAIGRINFLSDSSFEPYITVGDICDYYGTNKSTVSQKATKILKMFNLNYFDEDFSTKDTLEDSPFNKFEQFFTEAFGESDIDLNEPFPLEEINELREYIKDWEEKFIKSKYYGELDDSAKELCEEIINTFSEFMIVIFNEYPENWTEDSIMDCFLVEIPQKLIHPNKNFFENIPAILIKFFEFLDDKNLLRDAGHIAKSINKSKDLFIKNCNDPEQWDTPKSLINRAFEKGFNPDELLNMTTPKELLETGIFDELIEQFNDQHPYNDPLFAGDVWEEGCKECEFFKDKVYQIKISIKGSKPKIWRRVLVRPNIYLFDFHDIIQIVMGWYDAHLHQFIKDGVYYEERPPEGVVDHEDRYSTYYDNMRLCYLFKEEKDKMIYVYDLGDYWEHEVVLEKILPVDKSIKYPVCTAGKMNCPPEDCGGVWGFEELLRVLNNPDDEEYEEMTEWVGGDYDPKYFDKEEVNFILQNRYRC